ncbi:hypothetical protein ACFY4C_42260, partial [Actinomadura viridis]|uniref:hypothetical protein n=1 Tax=Actinomadura viridis TaxID=58110 RepID=UPI0036BB9940
EAAVLPVPGRTDRQGHPRPSTPRVPFILKKAHCVAGTIENFLLAFGQVANVDLFPQFDGGLDQALDVQRCELLGEHRFSSCCLDGRFGMRGVGQAMAVGMRPPASV